MGKKDRSPIDEVARAETELLESVAEKLEAGVPAHQLTADEWKAAQVLFAEDFVGRLRRPRRGW